MKLFRLRYNKTIAIDWMYYIYNDKDYEHLLNSTSKDPAFEIELLVDKDICIHKNILKEFFNNLLDNSYY